MKFLLHTVVIPQVWEIRRKKGKVLEKVCEKWHTSRKSVGALLVVVTCVLLVLRSPLSCLPGKTRHSVNEVATCEKAEGSPRLLMLIVCARVRSSHRFYSSCRKCSPITFLFQVQLYRGLEPESWNYTRIWWRNEERTCTMWFYIGHHILG